MTCFSADRTPLTEHIQSIHVAATATATGTIAVQIASLCSATLGCGPLLQASHVPWFPIFCELRSTTHTPVHMQKIKDKDNECRRAQVNALCPHLHTIHASQFHNITYKLADLQFLLVPS